MKMKKTYEKPVLIRRERLTEIAASPVVIASNSDQNGDNDSG